MTSPAFHDLPTAEQDAIAERIGDAFLAHFDGASVAGVDIDDVVTINAANHRIYGEIDGIPFSCQTGDMSGFLMESWGDEPVEPPVPPNPMVLGPPARPESAARLKMVQAFLARDDVREAERAHAYDAHVSPTDIVRKHYDAVARRLGLQWMTKSERDRLLAVKP